MERSKILPLNPILGGNGLLRVIGRLQKSAVPYEKKPIILPQEHSITRMIIEAAQLIHTAAYFPLALGVLFKRIILNKQ